MVIGFLAFCLTATLFIGITTSVDQNGIGDYDPWCDVNDDGIIDIVDIVILALKYEKTGTPINKTALLLELNATVTELQERVEALETRIPKKGYVSVPAAAFTLKFSTNNTVNYGNRLYNNEASLVTFYAPVQLPHGSTVKVVTSHWYDKGDDYIGCALVRCNWTDGGIPQTMAVANSAGSFGHGAFSDHIINYATIDNSFLYSYYFVVDAPPSGSFPHIVYYFKFAIIEYEYPA